MLAPLSQDIFALVFCATSCINKLMLSSECRRAVLDVAGAVLVMPDVAPAATTAPLPAEPQELPATTRALAQLVADLRYCQTTAQHQIASRWNRCVAATLTD
jgi:hypothetical protein